MNLSRAALSTVAAITAAVTVLAAVPATAGGHGHGNGHGDGPGHGHDHGHGKTVRFQTFNASLNRAAAGQLVTDLSTPNNAQAATVAEIIQRTRPDVLLINEFDYVPGNVAIDLFRDNYLEVPHNGAKAIHYSMPSWRRPTRASRAASTSTTTARRRRQRRVRVR